MKLLPGIRTGVLPVLFLLSSAALAADDIVFRTTVTPEDPWLGQQVRLNIDVLAKDGWAQLRKVGDAEVDGAYLMRLESQGTRLSETIDGDSWSGQRYEFMIFPQRDGLLSMPATPVDVEVTRWGTGGGKETQRLSLPDVTFTARTPPGAEGLRGIVSTSTLIATQSWNSQPDGYEVGDAIQRSITLQAADVSAMAFAPLRHEKIDGLGTYPGEPTVDDKFNRGDLSGTRIETVTYVLERVGKIEIPAFTFSWWDVRNSELRRIELPGVSLDVAAGPSAESATAVKAAERIGTEHLWAMLLGILIASAVTYRYGGRLIQQFSAWRKARSESEGVYFKKALAASRTGDHKAVFRHTMQWLDRINHESKPARLDEFLARFGDEDTQVASLAIADMLDSACDNETTARFARGIRSARAAWLRASRKQAEASAVLPELNG